MNNEEAKNDKRNSDITENDNASNLNNVNDVTGDNVYSEDDKMMFEVSVGSDEAQNEEENTDEDSIQSENNSVGETSVPVVKKKKKKKKKKSRHLLGGLLLMTVILSVSSLIAISVIVFSQDVLGLSGSSAVRDVNIQEGARIQEIADTLKKEEIIDYPKIFLAYCKATGAGANFYPGLHSFSDAMSYGDIIEELNKVKQNKEEVKIMFKEGITLYDAAQLLEKNKVCDADAFIWEFNKRTKDDKYPFEKLVKESSLKYYMFEGYFFPDTYNFFTGMQASYVVNVIKDNYNSKVYKKYYSEIQKQKWDYDRFMTLASIVQSEAGDVENMKKVASVYINRLNDSDNYPRLQSDPTTTYVKKIIKPTLKLENDQRYIAYDTYQGLGLPPGAISNPGIDAIEAVLYPASTDYYYFCTNIKTGEFYYAKTNSEHEKNLRKAGLK